MSPNAGGGWRVAGSEPMSTLCYLGYSDFHNLMGFTSKKIPNNIL
jgi:hypothetical protein